MVIFVQCKEPFFYDGAIDCYQSMVKFVYLMFDSMRHHRSMLDRIRAPCVTLDTMCVVDVRDQASKNIINI